LVKSLDAIDAYKCLPKFLTTEPVAKIEDLNIMAPNSIIQNLPIKYLHKSRPIRDIGRGAWAKTQVDLMKNTDKRFDNLV
jgi:hypothetical protein